MEVDRKTDAKSQCLNLITGGPRSYGSGGMFSSGSHGSGGKWSPSKLDRMVCIYNISSVLCCQI